ncbi:MAG: hypothetical protein NTV94_03850, partial [Planctomycetota bacterium]|nr:hypothetical protein [Planctomycetota bacterium]
LLLERASFPRNKVCGCCLAPAGVQALDQAGLGEALADAVTLSTVQLRSGRAWADIALPAYRVISRTVLDLRLATLAAAAGVRVHTGVSARVGTDNVVSVVSGDRTVRLFARAVLVCDGLGGTSLKDHPAFTWSTGEASYIGLGATLSRSPWALQRGQLQMVCGADGYLGLVELPGGSIDAAAAVSPEALRAAGSPEVFMQNLVHAGGGDADPLRDVRWTGTPLLTRRRSRVSHGRIVLVGDSAGYVEPFTGEGMTWAIECGLEGAKLAHRMMHASAASAEWESIRARIIGRRQRICGLVARALRRPALVHAAVRCAWLLSPVAGVFTRAMLGAHQEPAAGVAR